MSDLTQLLSAVQGGEPRVAEQLLPQVYEELRKLAAAGGAVRRGQPHASEERKISVL